MTRKQAKSTKDAPENGLKSVLQARFDDIRETFLADGNRENAGLACVQARADAVDDALQSLFKQLRDGDKRYAALDALPCVVATGGYGRGELAPFSDIDLLFLLPDGSPKTAERFIAAFLQAVWDMGLKPGHAARTPDECIEQARTESTIMTALLERRHVAGQKKLYTRLGKLIDAEREGDRTRGFVIDKLTERDARHDKQGNSRYRLEPNVKEGKGGLRDLQTLYWLAAWLYGARDTHDLVARGVFDASAGKTFDKARNFLLSVRCHLHYLAGRAEERLNFDLQPEIARRMGYKARKGQKNVERFMKHYFLIARETGTLTRVFCAKLEDQSLHAGATDAARVATMSEIEQGFPLKWGRLTVEDAKHFERRPVDMLRLFRVAQVTGRAIRPEALMALHNSLKHVDRKLQQDAEANKIFLDILCNPKAAENTLRRMNEAGILGVLVPDFGRIVAHMQYDMYHVYTADEHLLRAVGFLHKIERGDKSEDAPLATKLFEKIESRRALYVAIFLHDIAKGRGGDHSVIGEQVARDFCPRVGLSEEETENVAWLVRRHLVMSDAAFRRDLNDPKTIRNFVETVQNIERLRMLLILTCADIMAVGPGRWNSWKASLLEELYEKAEAEISGRPRRETGRIVAAKEAARKKVRAKKAFDDFADKLPGEYWLYFEPRTIAEHAELVKTASAGNSLLGISVNRRDDQDMSIVTVYTPDRRGLFAQIAGGLAASGANIVYARIFTMRDGMALDIFAVQDLNGSPVEDEARLERKLRDALEGRLDPDADIAGRKSRQPKRTRHFDSEPRVIADNDASADSTMIEIACRDRPGLLYDVTRALTALDLQISSAKVTTYGSRAVDAFYVRDRYGLKVYHDRKLAGIRANLLEVLKQG